MRELDLEGHNQATGGKDRCLNLRFTQLKPLKVALYTGRWRLVRIEGRRLAVVIWECGRAISNPTTMVMRNQCAVG